MRHVFFLLAALLAGSPVLAQSTDPVTADPPTIAAEVEIPDKDTGPAGIILAFQDQAGWDGLVARSEDALAARLASDAAFGELRRQLTVWRDRFLSMQSLNASRVTNMRARITALGAVPENGEEDPVVAARRAVLTEQLRDLQAPRLLAAEAYVQANGLISEIDTLIREREAARATERTQSPLNPVGIGDTWFAIVDALHNIRVDVSGNIANPVRRAGLREQLPLIIVLLVVAMVFVVRGRDWYIRLTGTIVARTRRAKAVMQFLLSLGQVAVPFLGMLALSEAFALTGMTGAKLGAFFEALPRYGLLAILAHWFAGQLLPKNVPQKDHPMGMTQPKSKSAHRQFILLGYSMMIFGLARAFVESNGFDVATGAMVLFPIQFAIAWILYWFGHMMRRNPETIEDERQRSFSNRMRGVFSRGLMLAAAVGVVLTAVGYSNAFEVITYPAATTIYVFALLMLLQRLSSDTYSLMTRADGAAHEALMPVLIGFTLVVLALPFLAVIWGAQVTDITELWARFREGFNIGGTQISPSNFLLFAAVFVIGFTITRLVQATLRTTVLPRTKMDVGGQNAVVSGLGYIGIFLSAVIAITTAGIDLSGLAIVAGALSVGIGFGLQNIVSNFISGIILLIERPISQGDWIEVGGQMGYVRDISVRSTRIETFDRTDVIVPNADLISNQVTNWTRGNNVGRAIVPVGVAYGTDTDKVTTILREIAEAHPMVLMNPPPNVLFIGFGADSLDFEIRAILRDVNYVMPTKSEINHEIAKRFAAEGIEIPFAQRDLWLRNPETLNFRGPRPQGNAPAKEEPET